MNSFCFLNLADCMLVRGGRVNEGKDYVYFVFIII